MQVIYHSFPFHMLTYWLIKVIQVFLVVVVTEDADAT